jgi:hypothetical protein
MTNYLKEILRDDRVLTVLSALYLLCVAAALGFYLGLALGLAKFAFDISWVFWLSLPRF